MNAASVLPTLHEGLSQRAYAYRAAAVLCSLLLPAWWWSPPLPSLEVQAQERELGRGEEKQVRSTKASKVKWCCSTLLTFIAAAILDMPPPNSIRTLVAWTGGCLGCIQAKHGHQVTARLLTSYPLEVCQDTTVPHFTTFSCTTPCVSFYRTLTVETHMQVKTSLDCYQRPSLARTQHDSHTVSVIVYLLLCLCHPAVYPPSPCV